MDTELLEQQTANVKLRPGTTSRVEIRKTAKISPLFIFVLEKAGACCYPEGITCMWWIDVSILNF